MPRFHDLTVTEIHRTIRDAVVLTLQPKPEDAELFGFVQGQYLTFRQIFDGQELRRSYSICTGTNEGTLKVGIKRVDGGTFSNWANTELNVGSVVQAMTPMGAFHTPLAPDTARHHLGFAGGSGITPLLSILKTVLATEPKSRFTLVYANQSVNTIMFREELEDLKNRFIERLSVVHILEAGTQDMDLFSGRIDNAKCKALFAHWIEIETVDTAYICGPEPMMLTIAAELRDHGLPNDRIKFELFASGQPGRMPRREISTNSDAPTGKAAARLTMDGQTVAFEIGLDQTLLEAALANAVDAPFACRAGVCSTCRCRVVQGAFEMTANHALEDYEVERGYVLACQALPITETVVVDFDQ